MLEKREKVKKSSQLPLEEKDSGPSPEEILRAKRRLLIILLSLTIGLSCLFWLYRNIRHFQFPSLSIFSLPTFPSQEVDDLSEVSQLIKADSSSWSVYFKPQNFSAFTINPDSSFSDSYFDKQIALLQKDKANSGLITKSLPEGTKIFDRLTETNSQLIYTALITVPDNSIIFHFKINGQNIVESKKIIPQIVEIYYWSTIKLF